MKTRPNDSKKGPVQKKGSKFVPAVQPTTAEARSPIATAVLSGDDSIQMQAMHLGDRRLDTAQRHALAAHIGESYGNKHLQRVVTFGGVNDKPPVSTILQPSIVQRKPKGKGKAKPKGKTTIKSVSKKSYAVNGKTLQDAVADIETREEAGLTEWHPQLKYKTDADGNLTSATVVVDVTVTMPSWAGAAKSPKPVNAEWKRFYKALEKHEDGHVRLVREKLGEIAESLIGKSEADANAAYEEAKEELQKVSDEYDTATGHGEKEGTIIDLDIETSPSGAGGNVQRLAAGPNAAFGEGLIQRAPPKGQTPHLNLAQADLKTQVLYLIQKGSIEQKHGLIVLIQKANPSDKAQLFQDAQVQQMLRTRLSRAVYVPILEELNAAMHNNPSLLPAATDTLMSLYIAEEDLTFLPNGASYTQAWVLGAGKTEVEQAIRSRLRGDMAERDRDEFYQATKAHIKNDLVGNASRKAWLIDFLIDTKAGIVVPPHPDQILLVDEDKGGERWITKNDAEFQERYVDNNIVNVTATPDQTTGDVSLFTVHYADSHTLDMDINEVPLRYNNKPAPGTILVRPTKSARSRAKAYVQHKGMIYPVNELPFTFANRTYNEDLTPNLTDLRMQIYWTVFTRKQNVFFAELVYGFAQNIAALGAHMSLVHEVVSMPRGGRIRIGEEEESGGKGSKGARGGQGEEESSGGSKGSHGEGEETAGGKGAQGNKNQQSPSGGGEETTGGKGTQGDKGQESTSGGKKGQAGEESGGSGTKGQGEETKEPAGEGVQDKEQSQAANTPATRPGQGGVPDEATLSGAGDAQDRGGLTRVGRAYQKHGGRNSAHFGKPTGTPADMNAKGKAVLEQIIKSKDTTWTVRHHAARGDILEGKLPSGLGGRWSADGQHFLGFVE